MVQQRLRQSPPERRPPRRWDTLKAIGLGLMLGFLLGLAYALFGVRRWALLTMILSTLAGAGGGAFLFGLLTELRNRILRAV